jgi:putative aldouronate transport system permease protein
VEGTLVSDFSARRDFRSPAAYWRFGSLTAIKSEQKEITMTASLSFPDKRKAKFKTYLQRNWMLYAMLAPGLILLVIFSYYPMYGIVMAFEKFNPGLGFTHSPWVGLKYFEQLFSSPTFSRVLGNTLILSVSKMVSMQFCSVGLALLLNEIRYVLFKRTAQTILYLPEFLSWVVLGGILLDILSPSGLMGTLLRSLGLKPIIFLGSNDWFRPIMIITDLWKGVGWSTIIYLAALTGIDPALQEAAAVDGANRWQRILNVTLPGILPTIILLACLNLGNILDGGFDQILNMYNPTVYATGDIIDTYVYRVGLIGAQYSLSAAAGLFQSIIGFFLIILSYRLADRYAGYRIF